MAKENRYFWLRLYDDFFTSKRIKKLRKLAGGGTYLIIYLKMQLIAMKHEGILQWSGLDDNFADELALELDEEPANVEVTIHYLLSCGLAETSDNMTFFFPYAVKNVGSEGSSARRMRESRAKANIEESSQCAHNVRECAELCAHCYGEKEIEIEKDKDIDISTSLRSVDIGGDAPAEPPSKAKKPAVRFVPPTLEEVAAYVAERHSRVDPQEFIDFYASKGWMVGKSPMKDWRAACRNAEKWDRWNRKPAHGGGNVFMDMLREEETHGTQ